MLPVSTSWQQIWKFWRAHFIPPRDWLSIKCWWIQFPMNLIFPNIAYLQNFTRLFCEFQPFRKIFRTIPRLNYIIFPKQIFILQWLHSKKGVTTIFDAKERVGSSFKNLLPYIWPQVFAARLWRWRLPKIDQYYLLILCGFRSRR